MRIARPLTPSIFLIIFLAALHSAAGGADLFQWTDASGVIHFSDHPYGVPDSVRNAGKLLVRKGFLVYGPTIHETSAPAEPGPDGATGNDSASDSKPPPSISFSYSPQDTNVVIVNSTVVRRPPLRSCGGVQNCKSGFHPDFHDRRYIRPRVFNGGSRQYIHP